MKIPGMKICNIINPWFYHKYFHFSKAGYFIFKEKYYKLCFYVKPILSLFLLRMLRNRCLIVGRLDRGPIWNWNWIEELGWEMWKKHIKFQKQRVVELKEILRQCLLSAEDDDKASDNLERLENQRGKRNLKHISFETIINDSIIWDC